MSSSVFTKLFMAHLENACIANFTEADILFYRRYVDDKFCIFATEQDAVSFYNYIRSLIYDIIWFYQLS